MRIQKPEKSVGYILLIIGLIVILIPILISILILLGNMEMPQYIPKPSVSGTDEIAKVMADAFPLLNIIPTFLLFVVMIYAGSVLTGKGVGLIKEIQWKIEKAAKEEIEETAEPETKPTRKTRAEKQKED